MKCYNVMVLLVDNREENAKVLQDILTESGCLIKARLGLHEAGEVCSDEGLIILHLTGEEAKLVELESKLNSVNGIVASRSKVCKDW